MIYVPTDASCGLPLFMTIWLHFGMRFRCSGQLVKLGISTHNPRNEITFNVNRAIADTALRLFP